MIHSRPNYGPIFLDNAIGGICRKMQTFHTEKLVSISYIFACLARPIPASLKLINELFMARLQPCCNHLVCLKTGDRALHSTEQPCTHDGRLWYLFTGHQSRVWQ